MDGRIHICSDLSGCLQTTEKHHQLTEIHCELIVPPPLSW